MTKRSFIVRMTALFAAMALIATALITKLVEIQILQDPAEESRALTSTRKYTELASRGEVLDRNGVSLVSNSLGFSVEVDYYNWNKSIQNQVISKLCGLLDAAGASHNDELPITTAPPYEYTFADAEESDAAKKLRSFIETHSDWPQDPTAPQLFSLLCGLYGIEDELLLSQKRTIVGVRYYLDMRQFSAYNTPLTIATNVDIETVAKISESSLELPGVNIQVDDVRQYDTEYCAHILGRVAQISRTEYETLKNADIPYGLNDTLGKEGMEKALESYLRGIDGVRVEEVSKETGQLVSEFMETEPSPGDHCYLTIDLELQKVAEQALAMNIDAVREKGEKSKDGKGADIEGGAVVVLNLKTGEVLAMASYPTYDLSNYIAGFSENNSNPLKPFLNRAVQGLYPPGSTFKMATAVAALEEGVTTTTRKIRDEGVYKYYATYQPACWIWNSRHGTHGSINISQALSYSCNYYFYEVGRELGIERLNRYARAFGLGQKTGIELTVEVAGNLDGPESRVQSENPWYDGDTLGAAIGQVGHQFTPLQLAVYMSTILNHGVRYEPHLLKTVVDYTGTEVIYQQQPVIAETISISDSTIAAIKEGMKGVVTEDGTASSYFRSFPSSIGVGGKTGSAETRKGRSAHGVFVSFAPYDDPEIVVVVIGEHAGSGGSMSPVCIEIYNQYFGLEIDAGLMTTAPVEVAPPATTAPAQPTTTPPETTLPEATDPVAEPEAETSTPPETTDPAPETTAPETTAPETAPDTAPSEPPTAPTE